MLRLTLVCSPGEHEVHMNPQQNAGILVHTPEQIEYCSRLSGAEFVSAMGYPNELRLGNYCYRPTSFTCRM
jgi:hypothetical protein